MVFEDWGWGSTSEQLISNKLAEKDYAVFNLFLFFWMVVLTFSYASIAIGFSELAGATKSGIAQKISNQKVLNFCATFIRLCWSGCVSLIYVTRSIVIVMLSI